MNINPGQFHTYKSLFPVQTTRTTSNLGRELLENLGYTVVTATDPIQAIEEFRNHKDTFDLVITDKTMPHMTGYDMAYKLRAIRADIPIILCSGFQDKEDIEKQSSLGLSMFIAKPIGKQILAKAVRDVLDNRSNLDKR